jgi:uncharacterized membrane protein
MPFREKTAWLSLFAMLVTFGPYFSFVATSTLPSQPMPNLRLLSWFAMTVITQVIILVAGNIYLAIRYRQEARLPLDERERDIMRRSVNFAYYVLIVGMILVGCVMPFTSGGWTIVNAALFMIVIAELVHYGMVVFSYRRQAA